MSKENKFVPEKEEAMESSNHYASPDKVSPICSCKTLLLPKLMYLFPLDTKNCSNCSTTMHGYSRSFNHLIV